MARQTSASPTCPVLGVTLTLSTVGSLLSTVALAESVAVPKSTSVAVAVQVRVSPGSSVTAMVVVSPVSPLDQA